MLDHNSWVVTTTSERTINNYLLNDVIGKTVGYAEGVACIVKTVRTHFDYKDMKSRIQYECVNDEGEYMGKYEIVLSNMRVNGINAVDTVTWIPRDCDDSTEFDTKAVAGFLEGIEVV